MSNLPIQTANILVPKQGTDMTKWAVVACDQYTSEEKYWSKVREIIGNAPSTYNLMLPEIYLENENVDERIKQINKNMIDYVENNYFDEIPNSLMVVKRTCEGKTRTGVLAAFDLENYEFKPGNKAKIRATEATVVERIPPRMKIRKDALLEMPHILILIDDPTKSVIEPIANSAKNKVYDFEMMQNGGHIEGFSITDSKQINAFFDSIKQLDASAPDGLLFAVGDGNHSLASAKRVYEENPIPERRFALAELVNVHDEGIVFEPIHRVLFGISEKEFIAKFNEYFEENTKCRKCGCHSIGFVSSNGDSTLYMSKKRHNLAVGALQEFLDKLVLENKNIKIDYIHGDKSVRDICSEHDALGFILPAMDKQDLFKTVIDKGVLPRKTFSMGEANEKRYYLECRRIK